MLKVLTSVILTIVFSPVLSSDISELEKKLQSVSDTAKVSTLNKLCIKYQRKDPVKALEYAFQGIEEAKRINDLKGLAYLHNSIGITYVIQSNYVKASKHYFEALGIFQKMGDKKGEAKSIFDMAYMYRVFENESNTAVTYYKRAYEIFKVLNEKKLMVNSLNALGITYTEDKQFELGEEYFMKMLLIARKNSFENFEATALKQLGWHFFHRKDHDQSLNWYTKAKVFEVNRNNLEGLASVLSSLAYIYFTKGDKEKSIDAYEHAYQAYQETGNKLKLTKTLLGIIFFHMKDENYTKVIEYAEIGLRLSQEINHEPRMAYFYKYLHQGYDSLHQISKSFEYFKKYVIVNDSIQSKERVVKLAETRALFDLDLKNQDIAIKDAELKHQLTQRYFLISAIMLITVLAFLFIRVQYCKLKLKAANEQLQKIQLRNILLKNEDVEKELNFKKRELTSFTLNFIQKNNLINEIGEALKTLHLKALDSNLSRDLQKINNMIGFSHNIDKDWEQFKLYSEQVEKGFFCYLKQNFPNLTANELRLCALARLNLSSKEIASISGVTNHSVKIARYRLRKKLNLKAEENFNDFFLLLSEKEYINN